MSKSSVVTARVSADTLALLDRIASAQERSRSWIVARAIERHAKQESEFLDFLQEGLDDLEAGNWISHEELVEEIKARRESRRAA